MTILKNKVIRSDIQALRALSILVVVFYHAKIVLYDKFLFEGGYIGVDIFFVISGYLITQIIYEQSLNKNFNIKLFYFKRSSLIKLI